MSEGSEGKMEWRTTTTQVQAKGVVSASPRNGSGREAVPKGKGQWRERPKRGRFNGQPPNQDYQSQPRSGYDRRDPYSQSQRRGTVPDKRPSPRSGYQNRSDWDVKTSEFDSSADIQTGETIHSGSKKYSNSLNYLLNFKYAPRERVIEQRVRSGRRKHTRFNKELFLQANCQFVVCDSADYTVYAVEPDILVDWALIEQVRIFSHEVPSCPICLYPPTAAKITRCGHVYCWSCILHYLSLSEKSWHKCPICYDAVTKKNLKSVIAMESHQFAFGQKVTMRLMKRAKNTTLVVPKSQWKERELIPFNMNDAVDTCYAKLLLASPEDVLQQVICLEEAALSTQLTEAIREKSEEQCFIEFALQELKARREELSGKIKSVEEITELLDASSLESKLEDNEGTTDQPVNGWNVVLPETTCIEGAGDYEAAFSDEEENVTEKESTKCQPCAVDNTQEKIKHTTEGCDPESTDSDSSHALPEDREHIIIPETLSPKQTFAGTAAASQVPIQETYYNFYQAEDGQNIFLHPINARCLVKEYGSLEHCPEYLTAEIVEMKPMSQTEELRKRFRYLSHLPLTCEFVICEVDLKPPTVSKNTLEFFRGELQKRRQQRQRKKKMDKKREQKVDAKVAKMEGPPSRHPVQSINLSSDLEFPSQTGPMAMSPLSSRPGPFTQLAAVAACYSHDEGYATITDTGEGLLYDALAISPPSFAEALRTGKAVEVPKPAKKASEQESPAITRGASVLADDSDEDYIPPPTFQSTFSEALSAAISQGLEHHLHAVNTKDAGGGSGKRQKKPKKKLLFSTGHMKYN